ncbi:MAG TPA: 2-oxoglutarate dehydrogenase E1 component [Oligoflexia bacterium]|nr:2-oxoglutarate dehydrogenase E1 component [Oligoflexia bacterium]HMP27669.1 2-oxoglutarate dehydrogenase E1 component [Oligoflexia bacterium]
MKERDYEKLFLNFGENAGFLLESYQAYLKNPNNVDRQWADFFKIIAEANGTLSLSELQKQSKFTNKDFNTGAWQTARHNQADFFKNGVASKATSATIEDSSLANLKTSHTAIEPKKLLALQELFNAYRSFGHLRANVNPISSIQAVAVNDPDFRLLNPDYYGLNNQQLFKIDLGDGENAATYLEKLQKSYCSTISFEFAQIDNPAEREWIINQAENAQGDFESALKGKEIAVLNDLIASEGLEDFLHKSYLGAKRFSLEGSDSLLPLIKELIDELTDLNAAEIIIGMAHRGRINLLANAFEMPIEKIFAEFEDQTNAARKGGGDVKYHIGYVGELNKLNIKVNLLPNPSHLESINPVVIGYVRALQDLRYNSQRNKVVPLLIHGDAAFAGQGIVAETLQFSKVRANQVGGTIHVIINNQLGFTAEAAEARSSRYSSDIAKMINAPILRVNSEDLGASLWAAKFAANYRARFGKDVVIDLIGYRKYGHNEGDDPTFTQPVIYAELKNKKRLSEIYFNQIKEKLLLKDNAIETARASFRQNLISASEKIKQKENKIEALPVPVIRQSEPLSKESSFIQTPPPNISKERVKEIIEALSTLPGAFKPHPKIKQFIEKRGQTIIADNLIDWAFAEALAFGSILSDGINVRLNGQDSARGTFSQRHLEYVDYENGERFSPLAELAKSTKARFEVYNSVLSEEAVMGFEYGYSAAAIKQALVLWEAQFGDFANGAQVIIDQYIAGGYWKWNQESRLTLLLPHGYEGQGSEHSSARLERFLQLTAQNNFRVAYPTTAAQYFHLLRTQAHINISRPLIVMTPKSMLRAPESSSKLTEIISGNFQQVLFNLVGNEKKSASLIVTFGKVYFELLNTAKKMGNFNFNVLRIEELYPWPEEKIKQIAKNLPTKISHFVFLQEEPANMGAWTYIAPKLEDIFGEKFTYVGRSPYPAPAGGSYKYFQLEQEEIIKNALSLTR